MQRVDKEKSITCFPKAWLETLHLLYGSKCKVIPADIEVWYWLHICHLQDVTNHLLR